jgi:hypothetical protein
MTTDNWTQTTERNTFGAARGPAEHAGDLTIELFVQRNDRGFRRLLAVLCSPILDGKLAAGCSPESGRLLAARAERLVSAPRRRRLVQGWERLMDQAGAAPRPRNPHAPLCRDRIVDATDDVRAMLGALSSPFPVSARGVAMAGRLLSDGTGPLYGRSCTVPLSTALREVTAQLDPAFSSDG